MKNFISNLWGLIAFVGVIVTLTFVATNWLIISPLRAQKDAYEYNGLSALRKVQHYRVHDSLSAARVMSVTIKLREYEQIRTRDAALIKELRLDKKRLESATTVTTSTVYNLELEPVDSIIRIPDSTRVGEELVRKIPCYHYTDDWITLDVCEDNDQITASVESRDSLLVVENYTPRHFWFIKWGVKSRSLDVVSRNPSSIILNVEYVRFMNKNAN